MATDVLVMPLWRYLSGDFQTGTEAFAKATGVNYVRTAPKADADAAAAQDWVRDFRRRLRSALGQDIRWRDDGETRFNDRMDFDQWHALRAFAADQSRPEPGFRFDGDSHKHPGLAQIMQSGQTRFVSLICHCDHCGGYLPSDFETPFQYPLFENAPHAPTWGSSLGLLRELNVLGTRLRLTRDMGQDGWSDQLVENDPLERVKLGWMWARQWTRLSVEHKLPVIFDG
jgi:hypothetical protein